MYTLRAQDFRVVDRRQIRQFVEFWERYYEDARVKLRGSEQPVDYQRELSIGDALSEQNVVRLLRWKDPRMLTHPKLSGRRNEPNPRVLRVLHHLGDINRFRQGEISQGDFETITARIFQNGIVWRLYLFHIARPLEWPIADRNVLRAYATLFQRDEPQTLEQFQNYVLEFGQLAACFQRRLRIDHADVDAVNRANKRLDSALMMYGQFLRKYDRA